AVPSCSSVPVSRHSNEPAVAVVAVVHAPVAEVAIGHADSVAVVRVYAAPVLDVHAASVWPFLQTRCSFTVGWNVVIAPANSWRASNVVLSIVRTSASAVVGYVSVATSRPLQSTS